MKYLLNFVYYSNGSLPAIFHKSVSHILKHSFDSLTTEAISYRMGTMNMEIDSVRKKVIEHLFSKAELLIQQEFTVK